ncbi:autotransporter-associated beta strand repeat-containing protein [Haloferula sp. BvORR071]|uniref:beta strand repeat-containing protein n=1 Tax=Haloferula sp. BvORR071 TaxID=1396141 RepID=UPI0005538A06|nr:autotransporter-associated beta strand repeat-containing protein [Haloferula sp. BvORR071]
MKYSVFPILASSLLVSPALAESVTMTGASGGTWTDGAIWSNSLAPDPANDYGVSSKTLASPSLTTTATSIFAGGNLSVSGGTLSFPGSSGGTVTHTYTFSGGELGSTTATDPATAVQVSNSTLSFVSTNGTTKAVNARLNFTGNNIIERTGSNFTQNQNFNRAIYGSGTLTVNFTNNGSGASRFVNIASGLANAYSGAVVLNTASTSNGGVSNFNLGSSLGTASYEIRNGWSLNNNVAGGLDASSAITLVNAASRLVLTNAWNNTAGALTVTNGTVSVGNAASSIGNLSGAAGTIQGIGASSALTVNQTADGTYAGALGFTAGNALTFVKDGPAKLYLTGVLNTGVPLTIANGGLGWGSSTSGPVVQNGGSLLLNLGTSSNDQAVIAGNYTRSAGNIAVQVTSPPTLGTPYTLVTYQGTLSGNPPVVFNGLSGSRVTPSVDYGTGSNSAISVSFSGAPAAVSWKGTPGAVWASGAGSNWSKGGSTDNYFQFDAATFDDSATGTTSITLNETVTPGSVTFANNSKSYTITGSGAISGVTGIDKTGSGNVILGTTNSHSGINLIAAGTLTVGSGGTSGSLGTGEVQNGGTLAFNRSDSFTFPNVISGAGAIAQLGSGTTILTGDNSYDGSTTISAGKLQVGAGGATGSLGNTSVITNNGTLAFNRDGSLLIFAAVGGSGSVVENGPGTTILAADANYTGGTTINGGTLQLGNGDVAGSLLGAVVNYGTLAINRSDDVTFSNPVYGSGAFSHAGIGSLRFGGTMSYTGETRVGPGTLVLDASSHLPAGGALAFTAGNGLVQASNNALTSVSSLRAVGPGGGSNTIVSDAALAVGGGNFSTGPTTDSSHVLDLSYLPSFTYNVPSGTINVGSQSANGATRSATLLLPATSSLTAATLNIQTVNGAVPANNTNIASGTLQLGVSTTLRADTINMGLTRDNAALVHSNGATNPSLVIRGTDGSSRTNINMGSRGTAYGPTQNVTIDLLAGTTGSTLDALVGSLKIGDYGRGLNQIQNASFVMGAGTLDASEIILGNIYNNNGNNGVLNATLTVEGGTVKTPSLNFGSRTNGALNATANLRSNASLATTAISAGTGTGNRILSWENGTITNLPGGGVTANGVKFRVPHDGNAKLVMANGELGYFGSTAGFEFHYDGSLVQAGKITASGAMELGGSVLTVVDDNLGQASLAAGSKFVMIQYSGGSLAGVFSNANGDVIEDGDTITVGSQLFVLDYDDPAYGGKAVTLTVSQGGNYAGWAAANAGGGGADADYDHDGVANAVEFFMGQTGSSFTVNPPIIGGKVTWPKDPQASCTYEVQTSEDLAAWIPAITGVVDSGTSVQFTLPASARKTFARLKVILP